MCCILFYKVNDPYGCLSNFASYPIILDGILWKTTEHYFQAQKFAGTKYEEEVRMLESPMDAALYGRDRTKPLREDWQMVKDEIMNTAVKAKIDQNDSIKDILISTGNCILVEHTCNDSYWADNGDGSGKNMLGEILMKVRRNLKEYTGEFYPPAWIAYPQIDQLDMFWRLGEGAAYLVKFKIWFSSLSINAQKEYNQYFKSPANWQDIQL